MYGLCGWSRGLNHRGQVATTCQEHWAGAGETAFALNITNVRVYAVA